MQRKFVTVVVVGLPNSGKSTLVNALIGQKVTIVSPKSNTTRNVIRGIGIFDELQVVFVDTPGIFKAKSKFDKGMVSGALSSLDGVDLVILTVDASPAKRRDHLYLLQKLNAQSISPIIIINKTDRTPKPDLLKFAAEIGENYQFSRLFMVSALKRDGLADVISHLKQIAPESEWGYDEDQVSLVPMRFFAAEITRESILYLLSQEIPHNIHVETEMWEEKPSSVTIHQAIWVDKESQKKIVIGDNATMVKEIGIKSRRKIEAVVGKKVNLKLFVKVQEGWKNKDFNIQPLADF